MHDLDAHNLLAELHAELRLCSPGTARRGAVPRSDERAARSAAGDALTSAHGLLKTASWPLAWLSWSPVPPPDEPAPRHALLRRLAPGVRRLRGGGRRWAPRAQRHCHPQAREPIGLRPASHRQGVLLPSVHEPRRARARARAEPCHRGPLRRGGGRLGDGDARPLQRPCRHLDARCGHLCCLARELRASRGHPALDDALDTRHRFGARGPDPGHQPALPPDERAPTPGSSRPPRPGAPGRLPATRRAGRPWLPHPRRALAPARVRRHRLHRPTSWNRRSL